MEETKTSEIIAHLESYQQVAKNLAEDHPTAQFYRGVAWAYAEALAFIRNQG